MDNEKKYNVLVVHNYYQIPGGEDTVVANEIKMLKEHGNNVIFYSRNNSELNEMSKFRKLLLPFSTVFNIKTYKEIRKIIKENNINIVHVHNTLNLISQSVYYAAVRCKVPVVQMVHNFRLLCPGAIFYRNGHICEDCIEKGLRCAVKHKCYRNSIAETLACVLSTKFHRAAKIYGKINYICLTEFNKNKLIKLKQIDANKIFIKPNFVENSVEFVPLENRKNQFVFAGRLDRLKGIDILLKAWKYLGDNAPLLLICGTGPMEEWCKQYISENNLNAEMLGFVPNEEVRRIIAQSKALVLPTQLYEGFPMSIVEAFSTGTPVLCSDLGNAGSIVTHGVTGMKFVPDDSQSVADIVRKFEESDQFALGKNAYNRYINNFSENSNHRILMQIYNDISL